MHKIIAVLWAATSCVAMAQAQTDVASTSAPAAIAFTLEQALSAAGASAPAADAAAIFENHQQIAGAQKLLARAEDTASFLARGARGFQGAARLSKPVLRGGQSFADFGAA